MQADMEIQSLAATTKPRVMRRWKTLALYGLVIGAAALVISRTPRDFSLSPEQVRPTAQVAALVFGLAALWGVLLGLRAVSRRPRQTAWRMSLRLIGWMGVLASAGGIILLGLQDGTGGLVIAGSARAVELVVPLVLAIQAALIFSPADEPGLEVLLACPRPAAWLLLERVALLGLLHGGAAVAGILFCRLVDPVLDVPVAMGRWLPPALLLSGTGVYVTLRSRVAAFGAAIAGMVWFVFVLFGPAFLPGAPTFWPLTLVQPFAWMVNPYLQPGEVPIGDYHLNRLIVITLGVVAFMAAARQVGDEERLLLNGRKTK